MRVLPVMGRLRMSRVVSASAVRAFPVLGCFLVSQRPMKPSRIKLVGGRIRALRIFLSRKSGVGMAASYRWLMMAGRLAGIHKTA